MVECALVGLQQYSIWTVMMRTDTSICYSVNNQDTSISFTIHYHISTYPAISFPSFSSRSILSTPSPPFPFLPFFQPIIIFQQSALSTPLLNGMEAENC